MTRVLNEILLLSCMAVFVTGDRGRGCKPAHLAEHRSDERPGSHGCRVFSHECQSN